MGEVRTHTFNKRKYEVYIGPLKGLASASRREPLELFVRSSNISERQILLTTIHEALHACDWDMSEKKVDMISTDIGSFLWRLGYRQCNGTKT